MDRNSDVTVVAAVFALAGAVAIIGAVITFFYVAGLAPDDVERMLADRGEESSSRALFIARIGGWQYLLFGAAALVVAGGLFNMQSWARILGYVVVGLYVAWEVVNVLAWYAQPAENNASGADVLISLVMAAGALGMAVWLRNIRDEFGPQRVAAMPSESRFFTGVRVDATQRRCATRSCGRALQANWRWCPYCHTEASARSEGAAGRTNELADAHSSLLSKLGGDGVAAERLIEYERRRRPRLSDAALARAADERLLRDRRGH
jgi:hypothetical protein